MNPSIRKLSAPLLITLAVVGCFSVLFFYALGRADAIRPHPVAYHTGKPDMDAPMPSGKTANAKEVKLFFRKIAREAKAHEDAVTIARIYGVTPQNIDADIFGRGQ